MEFQRKFFDAYVNYYLSAIARNFYWDDKKRHYSPVSKARVAPPGARKGQKLVKCIPETTEAFGVLIAENFMKKWTYMKEKKASDKEWKVPVLCVGFVLLTHAVMDT